MTPLQQIRKLWLSRLLWLLVILPLLVFVLHLQVGIRFVKLDPFTLPDGRVITTAFDRKFDFQKAMAELRKFPGDLLGGRLNYQMQPGDPGIPVKTLIADSWGHSFRLYAVSVGSGAVLGVLLGTLVALRGRMLRGASLTTSVLILSLPDFFVVLTLQFISSWFWLHYDLKPFLVIADPTTLKGWLVPLMGMSLFPLGYMARLTATAMDDVMQEDYIRTARSKGLPERVVILGHALRNAAPRVLAGFPTLLNATLSSLPVVERFTVWPGISKWFIPDQPDMMTGQIHGITPGVASVAVSVLILWFVLFDGLAHTGRIIWSPKQAEVMRA